MSFIQRLMFLVLALCVATAWEQPLWGQPNTSEPHIGYLHPAGGQQGSVIQILAGGQFLRGATDVYACGGLLGTWSGHIVPGFDKKHLGQLPAAATRYVLQDEQIQLLVIDMHLRQELDANIRILSGDATYTPDDRALLAEFCARAYDSDAIKRMRID